MILTDEATSAITRARAFAESARRQGRPLDAWRDLMARGDDDAPGSSEMYLMEVALEFAEVIVELADWISVARRPTDTTILRIAAARKFVAKRPNYDQSHVDYVSPIDQARDFAEALVELAGTRPNKVDAARVERGLWDRAAGDVVCESCSFALYDHPVVPGIEWLRRRCDGRLVKL